MELKNTNPEQTPPQTPSQNQTSEKKISNEKYKSKLSTRLIFDIIYILSVVFIATGIITSQHREIITNLQVYNTIQLVTKGSFITLASMIVWFFIWPIVSLFLPPSKEQLSSEGFINKKNIYKSYTKIFVVSFFLLLGLYFILIITLSTVGVVIFAQFAFVWIMFIIIVRAIVEHMANSKNK